MARYTVALIILYGMVTDEDIVIQDNFAEGNPHPSDSYFIYIYASLRRTDFSQSDINSTGRYFAHIVIRTVINIKFSTALK